MQNNDYERSEVSIEIALFARPGPARPDRNANQTLISPELLDQSLRNQNYMIENFNQFYVI